MRAVRPWLRSTTPSTMTEASAMLRTAAARSALGDLSAGSLNEMVQAEAGLATKRRPTPAMAVARAAKDWRRMGRARGLNGIIQVVAGALTTRAFVDCLA